MKVSTPGDRIALGARQLDAYDGRHERIGAKVIEQFARSMSVADALDPNLILCYEMNGASLPPAHGAPVRLIAPGWYGVANVKWLERIRVLPTRYEGRFMGRDYVTMRTERHGSDTVTRFTLVGRDLLKSAPAKVARAGGQYRIVGAAWGQPVAWVEVSTDWGAWQAATLDKGAGSPFAWTLWSLPWGHRPRGSIRSSRGQSTRKGAPNRRWTIR
jgi:DMSO/TMAO reductase YedYZ molybdopterin-dependent catalytic subunit